MSKIFKILLFTFSFSFLFLSATPVLAASDPICFKPQIEIPGMDKVFEVCPTGADYGYKITGLGIGQFIIVVFKYSIGIIGILAAIVLMVGGVIWLTAGGNQSKVGEAQNWIKGSLTGLVLALTSFLLLSTINSSLVVIKNIAPWEVGERPSGCCNECTKTKPEDLCGDTPPNEVVSGGKSTYTCPKGSTEYNPATHICREKGGSYKVVRNEGCCVYTARVAPTWATPGEIPFIGKYAKKIMIGAIETNIGTGCVSGIKYKSVDDCNKEIYTMGGGKWYVPDIQWEQAKYLPLYTCVGNTCIESK
jgi:hypothetical protein